ncbi:thioesterase family protein, partial [Escherichia coli]
MCLFSLDEEIIMSATLLTPEAALQLV